MRGLESPLNAKNGHIAKRSRGVTASRTDNPFRINGEGLIMAKDDVTREEFDTEGEAGAFTEGLDTAVTLLDSDHLVYEPPYIEGDKWIVEVRIVC